MAAALDEMFFKEKYADDAVQSLLQRHRKWGSRDRSFVAESIYECVRWKRQIEFCLDEILTEKNIWKFLGTYFLMNGGKLPAWKEFNELNPEKIRERKVLLNNADFAVRASIPDWLNELGKKELGERWEKEVNAMNKRAPVIIRVNLLKTSLEQLRKDLLKENIETEEMPDFPNALKVRGRRNLLKLSAYQNGEFEIQDSGSQKISPFLGAEPGMKVIDACAGAGGKTLHLGTLMENRGEIIALDLYKGKLKELERRATRNGIEIIRTRGIGDDEVPQDLKNFADRLLIDAPCSGLGVLRRNPDAKWKLTPEFMEEVKQTQSRILNSYSSMLKPGGILVYATCSILPSENQFQTEKFLAEHKNFQMLEEKSIFPSEFNSDGYYMARLRKND